MNFRSFFDFLAGKAAECFSCVAFADKNHLYSIAPTLSNSGDSANGNITNSSLLKDFLHRS